MVIDAPLEVGATMVSIGKDEWLRESDTRDTNNEAFISDQGICRGTYERPSARFGRLMARMKTITHMIYALLTRGSGNGILPLWCR